MAPYALQACQAGASSPPETLAAALPDAAAPACLAESHPVLAHVGKVGESELVALDATGSASIVLARGAFVYGSTWAPDGRSIAFRRRSSASIDALAPIELGLFSADVPGEEVVLLVDSGPTLDGITRRSSDGPSWSPDGRQLAFASLRDSDHYRVWGVARSGGQARLLLPELDAVPHSHPRWSPRDPARLAYVAEDGGVPDLWVVNLRSGEHQRLTFGEMEKLESPRWSPDGETLAFAAVSRDKPSEQREDYDIYRVGLAGASLERITQDAGSNVDPSWAPEGASLLVSSTRDLGLVGPVRTLHLWRVWPDGAHAPERLTRGVRGTSTVGTDWFPFADCDSSGG